MGYHTAAEIPNYWAYAKNFVLQDHMFEPVSPGRWLTTCTWSPVGRRLARTSSPMSCVNNIGGPYGVKEFDQAVHKELTTGETSIDLAWTDITWLLYAHHVSWAYYVQPGSQPDCANDGAETCATVRQDVATPGIWNPLPLFGDVRHDHQVRNIQPLKSYLHAAAAGTLPAVSWITRPARTASTRRTASTGARRTSRR